MAAPVEAADRGAGVGGSGVGVGGALMLPQEATFASKKDWKEQFGMYAKKLLKWCARCPRPRRARVGVVTPPPRAAPQVQGQQVGGGGGEV